MVSSKVEKLHQSGKNSPHHIHLINLLMKPSMVMHIYNPSTREAEMRGLSVGGQPDILSKTLSQNNKKQCRAPVADSYL
jgi:hypothetical protein